jgi:hypothetical protein
LILLLRIGTSKYRTDKRKFAQARHAFLYVLKEVSIVQTAISELKIFFIVEPVALGILIAWFDSSERVSTFLIKIKRPLLTVVFTRERGQLCLT